MNGRDSNQSVHARDNTETTANSRSQNGRDLHVEVLERDPVVRIGAFQDCLENGKVIPRNEIPLVHIRDFEQYRELLSADAREIFSGCDGLYESIPIKVSSTRQIDSTRRKKGQHGTHDR